MINSQDKFEPDEVSESDPTSGGLVIQTADNNDEAGPATVRDFDDLATGPEDDFAVALQDPSRLNRRQTNPSKQTLMLHGDDDSGVKAADKPDRASDRLSMPRLQRAFKPPIRPESAFSMT